MAKSQSIDETGNQHARLTVLNLSGSRKRMKPTWLCQCVCGKQIEVIGSDLRSGAVKSCGCLRSFTMTQRQKSLRKLHHNRNFNALDKIDDDIL